ncbi:WXG100 family type VII secretion target [Nocardia halotolerans]|uniref:WXG100 family type VII secretion target n=1 Tax=Nocardia halotolerans TaxID=1755878 RepID=A0ABV8VQE2_9NOCA
MSINFYADPDKLRQTIFGMRTPTDNAHQLLQNLQASVAAEGVCWGTDDPGTTFASKYVEPAADASELLAKVGPVLDYIMQTVVQAADTIEAQDTTSSAAIRGVESGLGGN